MINKLISSLLLFHIAYQLCSRGCLRCNKAQECLFCDSKQNLFLQNGNCIESSKKLLCQVVDLNGNCLLCKGDVSYLDKTTSSCIEIAVYERVVNCTLHSEPKRCSVCNPDFSLNPQSLIDSCVPVTVKVSNCQRYSSIQKCLECKSGFYLDDNFNCQQLSTPQCNVYSPYRCNRCKTGSRFDSNAFTNYLQRNTLNSQVWSVTASQLDKSQLLVTDWPFCFSTPNCREYARDSNRCVVCDSDYSVDPGTGQCVKNPLQRTIMNCDVYDSPTTCLSCKLGLLSFDRTQCILGAELKGCLQHDISLKFFRCVKCNPNWYKHYSGQCLLRLNTQIANCDALSDIVDGCAKCKSGFDLTTDSTRCLPTQPNCLTYKVTPMTSSTLECDQCQSGYYWDAVMKSCVLGTIPFCKTVSQTSNECSECQDGYSRQSAVSCVKLLAVDNCDVSSSGTTGNCDRCSPQNVKFTIANKCVSFPAVANCKNHNSSGVCIECQSGYSLSGTVCNQINWPNCATYNSAANRCEVCQPGFVMDKANLLCTPLDPFFSTNCQLDTIFGINYSDTTAPSCRECAVDKAPFNWKYNNVCSYPVQSGYVLTGLISPVFCRYYSMSGSSYVCIECVPGKHLTPNGCEDTCVAAGSQPSYKMSLVVRDWFLGTATTNDGYVQRNYCPQVTSNGCELIAPVYYPWFIDSSFDTDLNSYISQPPGNMMYQCVKCAAGKIPMTVINRSLALRASTDPSSLSLAVTELNMFSTQIPFSECRDSLSNLWGVSSGGLISQCAAYGTFTFSQATPYSFTFCNRCNFGYTGILRSLITNCFSYNSADLPKCNRCKQGYYLATDFLSCILIPANNIPGCLQYEEDKTYITCYKCDDTTHYQVFEPAPLYKSTCVARTKTATYNPTSCVRHYFIDRCYITPSCVSGSQSWVEGTCYNTVSNCIEYETLASSPFYQCKTCSALYYLSGSAPKSCTLGTVANCVKYAFTSNFCTECSSGYFLSRGVCYANSFKTPNNRSGFCVTNGFSNCDTCRYDALRFQVKSLCRLNNGQPAVITSSSIANCATYLTSTTCSKCATGYYLSSVSSCTLIPFALNCATMDPFDLNGDGLLDEKDYLASNLFEVRCTACTPLYFLMNDPQTTMYQGASVNVNKPYCMIRSAIDPTASAPFGNCDAFVLGGSANHNYAFPSCNSCSSNSYSVTLEGKGSCVLKAHMDPVRIPTVVTNCHYYDYSAATKTYTCQACLPGSGWDSSSSTTRCPSSYSGTNIILTMQISLTTATKSLSITGTNVLVTRTGLSLPTQCLIASPPFLTLPSSTSITYVCITCNTGNTPIFSFPKSGFHATDDGLTNFPISTTLSLDSRSSMQLGVVNPSIRDCIDTASTFTNNKIFTTSANEGNCDYWSIVSTSPTKYGCMACKPTFVSTVDYTSTTNSISDCSADAGATYGTNDSLLQYHTNILRTIGPLQLIFPNNKCKTANQVVFAFLRLAKSGVEPTGVLGWGIYVNRDSIAIDSTNKSLYAAALVTSPLPTPSTHLCYNPADIAGLAANAASPFSSAQSTSVVTNCALYIVDITEDVSATPSSSTKKGLYCVACKSGFTPTYFESAGLMSYVTACNTLTIETGTPVTTTINSVSSCAYGLKSDTDFGRSQIDFTKCDNSIANCALYEGSGTSTTCALCKPGFVKSNDSKKCLTISGLSSNEKYHVQQDYRVRLGISSATTLYPSRADGLLYLYQWSYVDGFHSCSNNFYLVFPTSKYMPVLFKEACLLKGSDPYFDITTTAYNNALCQTFGFIVVNDATTVGCIICQDGKPMLKDSNGGMNSCKDIGSTYGTNCLVYYNVVGVGDRCYTCKSGFVSVNGACVDTTTIIPSTCNTINESLSRTSATVKCLTCPVSKPYLVNNDCQVGAGASSALPACTASLTTNCNPCSPGFVAVGTGSGATQTCIKVDTSANAVKFTDHDPKCSVLNAAEFKQGRLVCDICDTGHSPQSVDLYPASVPWQCYQLSPLSTEVDCSNFSADLSSLSSSITTTCLDCSDSFTTKYISQTTNKCVARPLLKNLDASKCQRYSADSTQCTACQPGFEAPFCWAVTTTGATQTPINLLTQTKIRSFTSPSVHAYLDSCSTPISDCNTNVFYHGLIGPDAHLFACHQCNTAGNIPYAFVRESAPDGNNLAFGNILGWGSYSFISSETTVAPGNWEGGLANLCHPLTYNFHPQYASQSSTALPTNCALAMVRVFGTFASTETNKANANPNNLSIFCSACKPGYRATTTTFTSGVTNKPYAVSSCTLIANCQSSKTFNRCDVCSPGYVFDETTKERLVLNSCVANSDINCYAAIAGVCILCDSGYFLNLDSICEPYKVPNCDNSVSHIHKPDSGKFNIYFTLTTLLNPGCQNSCIQGFISEYTFNSFVACTESLYSKNPYASSTFFNRNCKTFKNKFVSGRAECNTCVSGFTLMKELGTCVQYSDPQCFIASTDGTCLECASGYILGGGKCLLKNIPNCETHGTNGSVLVCSKCLETFVLQKNQCVQGPTLNCAEYDSKVKCIRCLPDYMISVDSQKKEVCLSVPRLNCQKFKATSYDDFSIECETCKNLFKFSALSVNDQSNRCLPFGVNPNCLTYSLAAKVSTSSLACSKCAVGYFYNPDDDVCLPRTSANSLDCTILDPIKDGCLVKKPTPPVVPTPPVIVPLSVQPTGINKCVVYSDSNTCSKCLMTHYLKDNTCIPVSDGTLATYQNCLAFNSQQICIECQSGYTINDQGKCYASADTDCLVKTEFTQMCLKCRPGFGLQGKFFEMNCVALNVADCVKYSEIFPYDCLQCGNNKYLNATDKTCVPITKRVVLCALYSADGVCLECLPGTVFKTVYSGVNNTINNTVCASVADEPQSDKLDPQCDQFEFSRSGYCSVCSQGNYLSNNQCIPCNAGTGCSICDSNNPSVCLLCASGYYQDQSQKCIQNPSMPTGTLRAEVLDNMN